MTRPQQEGLASEHLLRQGFLPYCPRYCERKPNKKPVIRPLFPRYLFISIDLLWHSILGTRGISHILMGCDGPQRVPDRVISGLQSREENGLVSLTPKARFAPGSKVKVTDGPLAGYLLVYEGMSTHERVKCLIDLLGRAVTIELEDKLLVAA